MVRAAYASAYHWSRAARRTEANEARGEWMLSHVHAVLGRADMAQHHARGAWPSSRRLGWMTSTSPTPTRHWPGRRRPTVDSTTPSVTERLAAAVPIADDEDRKIFIDDLAASPWFGLAATALTGVPAAAGGSRSSLLCRRSPPGP